MLTVWSYRAQGNAKQLATFFNRLQSAGQSGRHARRKRVGKKTGKRQVSLEVALSTSCSATQHGGTERASGSSGNNGQAQAQDGQLASRPKPPDDGGVAEQHCHPPGSGEETRCSVGADEETAGHGSLARSAVKDLSQEPGNCKARRECGAQGKGRGAPSPYVPDAKPEGGIGKVDGESARESGSEARGAATQRWPKGKGAGTLLGPKAQFAPDKGAEWLPQGECAERWCQDRELGSEGGAAIPESTVAEDAVEPLTVQQGGFDRLLAAYGEACGLVPKQAAVAQGHAARRRSGPKAQFAPGEGADSLHQSTSTELKSVGDVGARLWGEVQRCGESDTSEKRQVASDGGPPPSAEPLAIQGDGVEQHEQAAVAQVAAATHRAWHAPDGTHGVTAQGQQCVQQGRHITAEVAIAVCATSEPEVRKGDLLPTVAFLDSSHQAESHQGDGEIMVVQRRHELPQILPREGQSQVSVRPHTLASGTGRCGPPCEKVSCTAGEPVPRVGAGKEQMAPCQKEQMAPTADTAANEAAMQHKSVLDLFAAYTLEQDAFSVKEEQLPTDEVTRLTQIASRIPHYALESFIRCLVDETLRWRNHVELIKIFMPEFDRRIAKVAIEADSEEKGSVGHASYPPLVANRGKATKKQRKPG